jgi:transcriptional regulator with XRE-family HTH domain
MIDGKTIRSFRQKRGLSLADLSERSGLSVSYLSEIERGKKQPSLDTLEKLSTALNISKQGFFTESPTSPSVLATGEKIILLRQKKNLSQTQLAEKAGISTTYLCQIERGHVIPSLDTLKALAEALGVSPQDLMGTPSHVGYRIKKVRQERCITQAELAHRAQVSTGLIGQIESGKVEPSIKTLEKIAAAFSLSPCYFIASDDDLTSLLKPMNPELKELLVNPKVKPVLELLADCTSEELVFILKFIQLYKESHKN